MNSLLKIQHHFQEFLHSFEQPIFAVVVVGYWHFELTKPNFAPWKNAGFQDQGRGSTR